MALLLRQLRPGRVGIRPEDFDGAGDLGREGDASAAAPREDDAFAEALSRIANAAIGVHDVARAEPVARGASAVRAVEGEHARLDGRKRDAAVDAREPLAQPERLSVAGVDEESPLAELEGELDAVGEASLEALLEHEAVDDDVEIVGARAIELELVAEVDHGPVDACAHEAFAAEALELELELAFACPRDGRHDRELRAFGEGRDAVDDLLDGLRLDPLSAVRAVGDADTRIKEAQVVGDLGDGADRRARGLGEGALLDGDGRAQALDALDVGFGELLEKLARVCAQ